MKLIYGLEMKNKNYRRCRLKYSGVMLFILFKTAYSLKVVPNFSTQYFSAFVKCVFHYSSAFSENVWKITLCYLGIKKIVNHKIENNEVK